MFDHLRAGDLRHRVTIQAPGAGTQDPDTGEVIPAGWVDVLVDEPASIEPLSVRDFIAASSMQSVVSVRVKIRYHDGLNDNMRILHGDRIYNPAGWFPDGDSGREWLTAPCSEGLNTGE